MRFLQALPLLFVVGCGPYNFDPAEHPSICDEGETLTEYGCLTPQEMSNMACAKAVWIGDRELRRAACE